MLRINDKFSRYAMSKSSLAAYGLSQKGKVVIQKVNRSTPQIDTVKLTHTIDQEGWLQQIKDVPAQNIQTRHPNPEELKYLQLREIIHKADQQIETQGESSFTEEDFAKIKKQLIEYREIQAKLSTQACNEGLESFSPLLRQIFEPILEHAKRNCEIAIDFDFTNLHTEKRARLYKEIDVEFEQLISQLNKNINYEEIIRILENKGAQIIELGEDELLLLREKMGMSDESLGTVEPAALILPEVYSEEDFPFTNQIADKNKPSLLVKKGTSPIGLFHEYLHYLQFERGLDLGIFKDTQECDLILRFNGLSANYGSYMPKDSFNQAEKETFGIDPKKRREVKRDSILIQNHLGINKKEKNVFYFC